MIKNIFLLVLLHLINTSCTNKNNDYLILNELIKYINKNDDFLLNENGDFNKIYLKKYYNEKYDSIKIKKRILYVKKLNSIDSLKIANGEEGYYKYLDLGPYRNHWFNDDIFSKNEIQHFLKHNSEIIWEKSKILNNVNVNVIILNKNDTRNGVKISKPLLTRNKKHAIIIYYEGFGFSKLVTLKKTNKGWKIHGDIVDYL